MRSGWPWLALRGAAASGIAPIAICTRCQGQRSHRLRPRALRASVACGALVMFTKVTEHGRRWSHGESTPLSDLFLGRSHALTSQGALPALPGSTRPRGEARAKPDPHAKGASRMALG